MQDLYSLFVQASDMEGRARLAWLDSMNLSAESRRELEEMLRDLEQYSPGRTKVRTLVLGAVEGSVRKPQEILGERVGPYRLERLVVDSEGRSAGNMGHVYFARRTDGAFDQVVAIKVIQALRDDPESRRRFIQERRYLGELRHPNIVRILDAGSLTAESGDPNDEQPYFIMEWVEDGLDIATYCRQHDLGLRERVELFCQVCEGVAYAHSQGVVHRDLKPQNVLVDGKGTPRLLDFGISSRPEEDGDHALMQSAMTLAYASPEQLAKQPVGPASDIYSLGVILYELVAGCRPYEVSGDWEAARALVERMVLPKLAVGFDLDQIVRKALSIDLARRYHHMDELVADLQRFLKHEPLHAAIDHLSQIRLGYLWAALYWLVRYSRKYLKPLLALAAMVVIVLLGAAELGRRQLVALQNRLAARYLAGEAALALGRYDYSAAGLLALESEVRETNGVSLRILQEAARHLPRQIFSELLPQPMRAAAYSPDHTMVAVLLQGGVVQLRNAETGAVRYSLTLLPPASPGGRSTTCLAWSTDSAHLALLDSTMQLSIWETGTGRIALRSRVHKAVADTELDCSGTSPAGLTYAGPQNWTLMLPGLRSAQWFSGSGEISSVNNPLGCAPALRICLVNTKGGLELNDVQSRRTVSILSDVTDAALSPDGFWIAARLKDGATHIYRLGQDRRLLQVAVFGTESNPTRPILFQTSGSRLLLQDGGQWRVFLPALNENLLIRGGPDYNTTLDPASFFSVQPSSKALALRTEIGDGPMVIAIDGAVTGWTGDEVSGGFLVADQGGLRLSIWRLPMWPGYGGHGVAVMASEGRRSWAAGWTRGGALVLYSPVDGSIEHVLSTEVPHDEAAGGMQLWVLGRAQWLLSRAGRQLVAWNPETAKPVGHIMLDSERSALVTDGSGRWLGIANKHSNRSYVYETPGLKRVATFPTSSVLGIAQTADGDVAILLGDLAPSASRPRLEIYSPAGFVRRRSTEITGGIDFGAIDPRTLKGAEGPPCISLESMKRDSTEILFPLARLRGSDVSGCALLRVNTTLSSIKVEHVADAPGDVPGASVQTTPSSAPGMSHLEIHRKEDNTLLVSERVPTDAYGNWHPTPSGIAIQSDGVWREIVFSPEALKIRVCAAGVGELMPDFNQRFGVEKLAVCEGK
jgi:hypothetical protein